MILTESSFMTFPLLFLSASTLPFSEEAIRVPSFHICIFSSEHPLAALCLDYTSHTFQCRFEIWQ